MLSEFMQAVKDWCGEAQAPHKCKRTVWIEADKTGIKIMASEYTSKMSRMTTKTVSWYEIQVSTVDALLLTFAAAVEELKNTKPPKKMAPTIEPRKDKQ